MLNASRSSISFSPIRRLKPPIAMCLKVCDGSRCPAYAVRTGQRQRLRLVKSGSWCAQLVRLHTRIRFWPRIQIRLRGPSRARVAGYVWRSHKAGRAHRRQTHATMHVAAGWPGPFAAAPAHELAAISPRVRVVGEVDWEGWLIFAMFGGRRLGQSHSRAGHERTSQKWMSLAQQMMANA